MVKCRGGTFTEGTDQIEDLYLKLDKTLWIQLNSALLSCHQNLALPSGQTRKQRHLKWSKWNLICYSHEISFVISIPSHMYDEISEKFNLNKIVFRCRNYIRKWFESEKVVFYSFQRKLANVREFNLVIWYCTFVPFLAICKALNDKWWSF